MFDAEYIIRKLTRPSEAVLDPLAGTATCGIAAIKLVRKFIGIEINRKMYSIALGRLRKFFNEVREEKDEGESNSRSSSATNN